MDAGGPQLSRNRWAAESPIRYYAKTIGTNKTRNLDNGKGARVMEWGKRLRNCSV